MDVRQLSAIVAIADHGTFSAAARSLFTVQSNISGHVSRLEKELGVALVDRAHGGLTEDGFRVVERARRVLNEIEDITSDMTSRHDKVSGPHSDRGDRHDGAMAHTVAAAVNSPSITRTSAP